MLCVLILQNAANPVGPMLIGHLDPAWYWRAGTSLIVSLLVVWWAKGKNSHKRKHRQDSLCHCFQHNNLCDLWFGPGCDSFKRVGNCMLVFGSLSAGRRFYRPAIRNPVRPNGFGHYGRGDILSADERYSYCSSS